MVMFLLMLAPFAAAAPLESSIPIGGRPMPYSFLVATGPERGQQTCYVCEQMGKPGAILFTRQLSPQAGALFAKLDAFAADVPKEKGFKLWATYLSDDGSLDAVSTWTRTHRIRVSPAGVYDDRNGPPAYKLAPEADVTLLVFVDKKVVANLSLRADEVTDEAVARAVKAVRDVVK